MVNKQTSKKIATKASWNLKNDVTSSKTKSVSASALAQTWTNKTTSKKVATKASAVLKDWRTSISSKSAAGSALSQTKRK
jgi:hypothetical protein